MTCPTSTMSTTLLWRHIFKWLLMPTLIGIINNVDLLPIMKALNQFLTESWFPKSTCNIALIQDPLEQCLPTNVINIGALLKKQLSSPWHFFFTTHWILWSICNCTTSIIHRKTKNILMNCCHMQSIGAWSSNKIIKVLFDFWSNKTTI